MSEDGLQERQRHRTGAERPAAYTTKDFQLEVLSKLAETQEVAESFRTSLSELKAAKEQRLLKFDSRTLVAIGAVALSVTGYVLQDARNTARQDSEIESTKARVTTLERVASANTEGRIRTEVELGELHQGQDEIKHLIALHDARGKHAVAEDGHQGPGEGDREKK